MKKSFKRVFSALLLAALMLTTVKIPTQAAENNYGEFVDAFIVFADLHTEPSSPKDEFIVDVIGTAREKMGYPITSVHSAGDAFSVCADDDSRSEYSKSFGSVGHITQSIYEGLGDNNGLGKGAAQINYLWSDHDRYADIFYDEATETPKMDEKVSHFVYGAGADGQYGTEDDDNYYVYNLSMADLAGPNDRYDSNFNSERTRNNAISLFEQMAGMLNEGKPLFIISHQPLFERRDDNYYAENWCKAINRVAESRDVAFFFGHNHNHDFVDENNKISDYYYAKGTTVMIESMNEDGTDKDNSGVPIKLNFSHFCAGYLGTGLYNETTRLGTVMGVTIYENTIRYQSYDVNGLYTGSLGANVDVERDYPVGGKNVTAQKLYKDTTYGVTVEFPTAKKRDFSVERIEVIKDINHVDCSKYFPIATLLDYSTGYDITAFGSTKDNERTITLPRTDVSKNMDPAVYWVSVDGNKVKRMQLDTITEDSVTFTTNLWGKFFIGADVLKEDPDTELTQTTTSNETKKIYVPATTFKDGGKYLIVGEQKKGGTPRIYLNDSQGDIIQEGALTVTINEGTVSAAGYTGKYIEVNNDSAVWTATGNSTSGYTLTNNDYFISSEVRDNDENSENTLSNASTQKTAANMIYDASQERLHTKSEPYQYLYYSVYSPEQGPERWSWSSSFESGSESSRKMWIYEEVTYVEKVTSTNTYSIRTLDMTYTPYGNRTTTQLDYALLCNGEEISEDTLGGKFTFEVINDSGIIQSISDQGVIRFKPSEAIISNGEYIKIIYTWDGGKVYSTVKLLTGLDYNNCTHSYASIVTEPTATVVGYTTHTCIYLGCGYSNISNLVAATGGESTRSGVGTEEEEEDGNVSTETVPETEENPAPKQDTTETTTAYEEKTVYVRVDALEDNGKYLIIGEDSVGGNPIAHVNNNGNEGYERVTIVNDALVTDTTTYGNGYIQLSNDKAVWTAKASSSGGYRLTNNGGYLGGEYGNTVMGSSNEAAKVVYDAADKRLRTASGNTLYLYYSTYGDENWKWSSSKDSETSSRNMLLFKEVTVNVATTVEVEKEQDVATTPVPNQPAETPMVPETPSVEEDVVDTPEAPAVPEAPVYEQKTIYVRVDALEDNGKYLIIGEDSVGGNPIAHVNNNGNEGYERVTIVNDALVTDTTTYGNGYIEFNNDKAVWTAKASSSGGYRLTNNGGYLGGEYGNTVMGSSNEAAKVVYDAADKRLRTASGNTLYLYYSTYGDENWKWSSTKDSETSSRNMLLFKEVTVNIAVSSN